MADVGINFRQTLAYTTDGAGQYWVGGSAIPGFPHYTNSPTTQNGYTWGWEDTGGLFCDNLSAGTGDPRTAGAASFNNNDGRSPCTFRVDIPATGTYDIRIAAGRANASGGVLYLQCFDDVTSFIDLTNGTHTGNTGDNYFDATGVLRTSTTNWVSGNVAVSRTFASTILRLKLGDPAHSASDASYLAHISISQGAVATPQFSQRIYILP